MAMSSRRAFLWAVSTFHNGRMDYSRPDDFDPQRGILQEIAIYWSHYWKVPIIKR